jgi:hypothetical protein
MKSYSALILLVLITLPACGPTRAYRGTEREPFEVARLSGSSYSLQMVGISKVDNKELVPEQATPISSIELLPGQHKLEARYLKAGSEKRRCNAEFELEAEAGHVYRIDFEANHNWGAPRLELTIINEENGEPVSVAHSRTCQRL